MYSGFRALSYPTPEHFRSVHINPGNVYAHAPYYKCLHQYMRVLSGKNVTAHDSFSHKDLQVSIISGLS